MPKKLCKQAIFFYNAQSPMHHFESSALFPDACLSHYIDWHEVASLCGLHAHGHSVMD